MKYIAQPELLRLVNLYRKNWKVFLLSLVACVGLAVAFLLIKNPTFDITASVLVKEDSGSSDMSSAASSMMRGFAVGDILGVGGGAVDDEIIILGSYSNVYSAVRSLQLNTEYTSRPFLRKKHFFDDTPVRLIPDHPEMADTLSSALLFRVKVNAEGKATVKVTTKIKRHKITLAKLEGSLPMRVETEMGNFTLEATPALKAGKTTRLKIMYFDYASTTELYKRKLDIDFADKKSNVMFMMFKDVNKTRGKAFLTAVIDSYNDYSLEEKNRDAHIMADFLDKRIRVVQGELTQGDLQIEAFKEDHKLTDIGVELKIMLERSSSVKERRLNAERQIALLQTTRAFVTDPENKYALVPLTLGTTNSELADVLKNYNAMVGERQIMLRSTNVENPTIVRLDDRLNTARQTMVLTIDNSLKMIEKALSEVNDEENKMLDKLENVPLIERQFYTLQRENQVSNTMYLYLLQQQAQNDMKLNSDAPKTQIVDKAYAAVKPSSPKPLLIMAAAVILALIFAVIYLRALRAVKGGVDNAFELSQLIEDTPIYELHDDEPADYHQEVDEAYMNDVRNVRSEIDWSTKATDGAKVLAVASMEREAGKSKVAYHLAESIAATQRRVLLIDADLRYSKFGATPLAHTESQQTLLTMLSDKVTAPSQVYTPSAKTPYLQMIPATNGIQNPQAAFELLQSPQWEQLLLWARAHYDAVVIDTTALDLYPDTLPVLTQSDSNYFVFTAAKSTKKAVAQLKTLANNEQTKDLHLILNVSKKLS
jgi:uncharacterized protein involved in exopolysaccharide biosynthesis